MSLDCRHLLMLWASFLPNIFYGHAVAGNMRHLIVEACIARNILDMSAYSWSGYVDGQFNQILHSLPNEVPCWSSFVKGAPLNAAMVNALVSVPASR